MELRFGRPEIRADQSGGRLISGYAAVFLSRTEIGGMFFEQIKPGAFARAIRERQDCKCLVNHDPNQILGRVSNKTLALREDAVGLFFECDVAQTNFGDDLLAMVRRGDLSEMSFGFVVKSESWTAIKSSSGQSSDLRTLEDVDLFDVSPVIYPQYDDTSVSAARSRFGSMFPVGAPASAPFELRNRIAQAIELPELPVSEEELQERGSVERQLTILENL